MGRLLTDTSGGSTTTLAYSGADNSVASDGGSTYTGTRAVLVAVKTGGTGVLAYVDAHTDVVGQFTSTGTSLSGSTAYDPLGNVLSTASMQGHLGFQSEWTDAANGKVDMMARWYNPATGQFLNKDSRLESGAGLGGRQPVRLRQRQPDARHRPVGPRLALQRLEGTKSTARRPNATKSHRRPPGTSPSPHPRRPGTPPSHSSATPGTT